MSEPPSRAQKLGRDAASQAKSGLRSAPNHIGAMTIDVEDYFQVEAFKSIVAEADWDAYPTRIERNVELLLDAFAQANTSVTFFVLGWIAKRFPELVRRMHSSGHEIASHGYGHQRADSQTPDVFREDVKRAKAILEDITGDPVNGYRAPTFSISRRNWWVYDILSDEGYAYSSSLYPVSHDLYGVPDAPRNPFKPNKSGLLELPLSTMRVFNRNLPCSGGGYFRLMPYAISRRCIKRIFEHGDSPYIFYCHPWEFDTGQPRMAANFKSRFRHYTNIDAMQPRLARMLKEFSWSRMDHVFAQVLGQDGQP